MKLNGDTIKKLINYVKDNGEKEQQEIENSKFMVVRYAEIAVTFTQENGKAKFFGLGFETLNSTFLVGGDLELYMVDDTGQYSVNDERLSGLLNDYLNWRTEVLTKIGV